ncbi:MAG: hypothetical protein K2J37_07180 [Ruminococcus sp.]|nr:hypothetical protein [Ruminococcus sp.]
MNFQKLPAIVIFNIVLICAEIVLLSPGLAGLSGMALFIAAATGIVIFIAGNYLLFSSAYKKPSLRNKKNIDDDDFENAFKGWRSMNTPYNTQIDTALRQLEQFNTRCEKLRILSEDGTFQSAADEIESCIFNNFKRIINRLLICDMKDSDDVKRGTEYINRLIGENTECLNIFSRFIDEVAMMLDSPNDVKSLALQSVTDSLRKIQKSDNL